MWEKESQKTRRPTTLGKNDKFANRIYQEDNFIMTEESSFDLTGFSFTDLLLLQEEVKMRLEELSKQDILKKIREEVKKCGFSCQPDVHDKLTDLRRIELPYYFSVYTHQKNRDNIEDIHIADRDCEQEPWVKELNFEYEPQDDDDFTLISDWDWDDHEAPARAKANLMIPVYYQYLDQPPSKFKAVFEDGNVEDAYLKDGNIYVGDEELCSVGDHDYFIILSK